MALFSRRHIDINRHKGAKNLSTDDLEKLENALGTSITIIEKRDGYESYMIDNFPGLYIRVYSANEIYFYAYYISGILTYLNDNISPTNPSHNLYYSYSIQSIVDDSHSILQKIRKFGEFKFIRHSF